MFDNLITHLPINKTLEIKSFNPIDGDQFIQYYNYENYKGWVRDVNSGNIGLVSPTQLYILYWRGEDVTMSFTGELVDGRAQENKSLLINGWNYLGFTPSLELTPEQAFDHLITNNRNRLPSSDSIPTRNLVLKTGEYQRNQQVTQYNLKYDRWSNIKYN